LGKELKWRNEVVGWDIVGMKIVWEEEGSGNQMGAKKGER
jgi:hypothetical protein